MDQEKQENVQTDQTSAPVNTGDGSQAAGSQDQPERPSEAAMRKTAGSQGQAGSQAQAGDSYLLVRFKQTLAEVIKSEMGTQSNMITNFFTAVAEQQTQICNLLKNIADLTNDQHSETIGALAKLTELVQENRAKNEIMLEHNRQILQQSIATTDSLADFAATNEKILSTIESIGALITAISELTQEIHSKITQ